MSSLAYCLEKHAKHFSDAEMFDIERRAEAYRKEGFKAKDANRGAISDTIRDTEDEIASILSQAEKAGWKG